VSHPELGMVVGGKYRLLRQLGHGGMGTVFEVENTLTFKRAALKWLHPRFANSELARQRLIQEAQASSRVRHENVVDVYDVLEEGSSVFLVMELLEGEPLSERLARDRIPVHELIALLLPAMRGVAAAHAAGVLHRDVKPENIFLAREAGHGRVVPKIIDFGISKLVEGEDLTASGITMGTPRYASYEQLLGRRDVDARSDLYAFGVILYEALTGRAPYGGSGVSFGEQALRMTTDTPPAPRVLRPELPAALSAIVERATARDREQRHGSLQALIDALESFVVTTALPLELRCRLVSEGTAPEARGSARLNEKRVWTGAIAALAVGAAVVFVPREAAHPERSEPRAGTGRSETLDAATATLADTGVSEISPPPEREAPPDSVPQAEPTRPRARPRPPKREAAAPGRADPLHRAGPVRRDEF
jgi:serine/threonine protein kinase